MQKSKARPLWLMWWNLEVAKIRCNFFNFFYPSDNVPTHGDHRPIWPKFGEYRWRYNSPKKGQFESITELFLHCCVFVATQICRDKFSGKKSNFSLKLLLKVLQTEPLYDFPPSKFFWKRVGIRHSKQNWQSAQKQENMTTTTFRVHLENIYIWQITNAFLAVMCRLSNYPMSKSMVHPCKYLQKNNFKL